MNKNSGYFRRIHAVLFEITARGSILKHVDRLLSKRATHCKVLLVYFSISFLCKCVYCMRMKGSQMQQPQNATETRH